MSTSNDPTSDYHQCLASQARAARLRCAYSIEAVAKLAGVDPSVIVAIENEEPGSSDTFSRERVLKVLGLRDLALR